MQTFQAECLEIIANIQKTFGKRKKNYINMFSKMTYESMCMFIKK